ncbi:MAG: hypothetical protein AAGB93_10080 [Planctomycetota bacterium]
MRCHAAALVGAAPFLWAAPQGALQYAPSSGATDEQTWTVQHTLSLSEVVLDVGDEEEGGAPEMTMEASRTRSLTIAQVHDEARGGAPIVLTRAFRDVEESIEATFVIPNDDLDETLEASIEAPLDGARVRFRREDGATEWSRAVVDEDGDEVADDEGDELLTGLTVDAHLAGLLAGLEEPAAGASWEAEPTSVVPLVLPGGHLGAEIEAIPADDRPYQACAAGVDPLLGMDLHHLLLGESDGALEGEVLCAIQEWPAEGSGRATISIEVRVEATRDVLERMEPWLDSIDEPVSIRAKSATATLRMEGSGEIVWDLDASLPTAVSLELSLAYTLQREADLVTPGGQELDLHTVVELDGELTSAMSTD